MWRKQPSFLLNMESYLYCRFCVRLKRYRISWHNKKARSLSESQQQYVKKNSFLLNMDGYTLLAHLMKCCITDDKSRIFPNLSSLISGRKQTVLLAKLVLQSMPEIAVLKPTTMSVKVGVSEYLLHTKAFVTLVCKRFWKRNFDKIGFFYYCASFKHFYLFKKKR